MNREDLIHVKLCVPAVCGLIQKSKKARISALPWYFMDKVFLGWRPFPAKIFTFNYIANMMEIMAGYYHIGVI